MHAVDYLILAAVALAVWLAVRYIRRRNKTGGCSGNCGACHRSCADREEKDHKE